MSRYNVWRTVAWVVGNEKGRVRGSFQNQDTFLYFPLSRSGMFLRGTLEVSHRLVFLLITSVLYAGGGGRWGWWFFERWSWDHSKLLWRAFPKSLEQCGLPSRVIPARPVPCDRKGLWLRWAFLPIMPVSTRAHPVWTRVRTCLRHLTCKVDLLCCPNGRGFFLFTPLQTRKRLDIMCNILEWSWW